MQIFENYLIPSWEQMRLIKHLDYRPVQAYQGAYSRINYGEHHGRNNVLVAPLQELAEAIAAAVPEQDFNAAFIQRYEVGDFVAQHRDPRTNVGCTLILIFGQFEGATTRIHSGDHVGESFQLKQGDLLQLECTIDGIQGPQHSVTPVTEGTRYAFILNTIKG